MAKTQKKHGKGRLDQYYRLAKEKGYRARSSFKIIQLNQKYHFFTPTKPGKPMCVIDLCAAPGSWCQVATQSCPVKSLIVGVDLAPIKPLPNVISFQSDITTDHCRSQLRGYLKTWKADVVMHDGAPNVGMSWVQDAFTQSELVLQSLKLAIEFLAPGGWFVTKVFRSKDYNKLMWVFQQFFERCEATKPPSSRNVSAEIFVVCRGFKAPHKIDPRILDPKYVFEDLESAPKNAQAQIYNPEKKTRKREGYDEGDYLLFHRADAMEFVRCEDPVKFLSENNEFTWDKSNPDVKAVRALPQTTQELVECFKDLKVLGRKDFRMILRWRNAARRLLGLDKKEEVEEVQEELTTEQQIERELQQARDAEAVRAKRERRKRNEMRQKAVERRQLNMSAPEEIGAEAGSNRDQLFDLDRLQLAGQAEALVHGKQRAPVLSRAGPGEDINMGSDVELDELDDIESESEEEPEGVEAIELDSDEEAEYLADELDAQYEQYREQQAKSAEDRARRARESESWHGFESGSDSDLEGDDEDDGSGPVDGELSTKAAMFFDNPIFSKVGAAPDSEDESVDSESESEPESETMDAQDTPDTEPEADQTQEPEELKSMKQFDPSAENDPEAAAIRMTLAQQLALGQISKHDLINEGYNPIAFRDRDGLPQWFLDDEMKHTKRMRPITKEAAAAAKEQLKSLNARPIKKVAEAQARKQHRAHKRLERIRKKSDLIAEDSSKSEREKSEDIAKLMRGAQRAKTRPKVTVVAAKGTNKGLQGRPRGVKGKYKMVDGTMKKEMRAVKRIQKKRR